MSSKNQDQCDVTGNWQIHIDSFNGNYDAIKNIINETPSMVNSRGFQNTTPAHLAACEGHFECLALLLEKGTDVNAQDEDGMTPAHYAALHRNINCYNLLKEKGANIDIADDYGRTARACTTL